MNKNEKKKTDKADCGGIVAGEEKEIKDNNSEVDQTELKKKKERRKKVKEEIGPCPLCKQEHSYKRKDNFQWPSDRFFTCKKFKEMGEKDRGLTLEKFNGCSRCTSWRHNKQGCNAQPAKCTVEKPDGSKCGEDHSYLIHDCGQNNSVLNAW